MPEHAKMTIDEMRKRLSNLGYDLTRNQTDVWGKTWKYRTTKKHGLPGGGAISYFDNPKDLERYILSVEKIRSWQQ